jgi:hypothetical protein
MGDGISLIPILFGIVALIINIILVINIIKAGKYSQLTYELIRGHISKINDKESVQIKQEFKQKNLNKNIHEVWSEIQKEND